MSASILFCFAIRQIGNDLLFVLISKKHATKIFAESMSGVMLMLCAEIFDTSPYLFYKKIDIKNLRLKKKRRYIYKYKN